MNGRFPAIVRFPANLRFSASAMFIIWYRDLRLFLGNPPQIFGALVQPFLYLLVFGNGLSPSMTQDLRASYLAFLFPGMVGLTVLIAAVSSAVSLMWDRQFGFFRVIVLAPIPRMAIALGKILGGVSIAVAQGAIVLMSAPLLGISVPWPALPGVIVIMALGAAAMSLLGLALAVRMQSMQGFQMTMSLISMPMVFLSGAFFPLGNAPAWMRALAIVNPFTYAIDGLRAAMGLDLALFPLWLDAGVLGAMTVSLLFLTIWAFCRQE